MKKHFRFFSSTLLIASLTIFLLANWRLHYAPEIKVIDGDTVNYDVLCQLRSLHRAMKNNAATEMQSIYPEGFIFFNALYGLSWCDLAQTLNKKSRLYAEAHAEFSTPGATSAVNKDE